MKKYIIRLLKIDIEENERALHYCKKNLGAYLEKHLESQKWHIQSLEGKIERAKSYLEKLETLDLKL